MLKIFIIAFIIAVALSPLPTSALTAPNCNFTTDPICDYTYTGSSQTFTAPSDGYYQFEAWGGGIDPPNTGYTFSKGSYTSGTILLKAGQNIYVYVGQTTQFRGQRNSYNGGASGYHSAAGATDFRLIGGDWDDSSSLASRIMVAGGSGALCDGAPSTTGGLIGDYGNGCIRKDQIATGGTQVSTGEPGTGGGFGKGKSPQDSWGSGGGGGYWGGGAQGNVGDGGGGGSGSSFISGHPGAIAITSATNTAPRTDNSGGSCNPSNLGYDTTPSTHPECSHHYSGLIFTDTTMLAGSESMPDHNNPGATMTGNTGNGHARITALETPTYLSLSISPKNIGISIYPQDIFTTTPITATQTITTETNNPNGYALKLSMSSSEQRLTYHHPTLGSFFINPTNLSNSPDLSINSWGYSLDGSTFRPVPVDANPDIIYQTFSADKNQTTVTYGARVDMSAVAGEYTGAITYTVIAN
jgi:hypothetical protein